MSKEQQIVIGCSQIKQDKRIPAIELPLPLQNRLRILEVLLDQYGYVNRRTLCDLHGLETATISRDISTYKNLTDDSCFYNSATRRIEKLSNFKRVFP